MFSAPLVGLRVCEALEEPPQQGGRVEVRRVGLYVLGGPQQELTESDGARFAQRAVLLIYQALEDSV